MEYVVFCLLGYLFGSVTFGYLIPRLIKGVDVRALSSDGNPGTANAFLYGGVFCGILVLLADLGKGALPVFLAARHLDPEEKLFALVMAAPVVGHAYPLIDRYGKGGKAIAVSFGVLLGLYPVFLPVLLLAGVYLFFSLVLVVEPHSLRTGLTFRIWSVLGVHFTPLSSIKYGIVLIAFVVIRKHLPEIRRIPKGQACFALRKG